MHGLMKGVLIVISILLSLSNISGIGYQALLYAQIIKNNEKRIKNNLEYFPSTDYKYRIYNIYGHER